MELLTLENGFIRLALDHYYIEAVPAQAERNLLPMVAFSGCSIVWDCFSDSWQRLKANLYRPRPGNIVLRCSKKEFQRFCQMDLIRRATRYGFINDIPAKWLKDIAAFSSQNSIFSSPNITLL